MWRVYKAVVESYGKLSTQGGHYNRYELAAGPACGSEAVLLLHRCDIWKKCQSSCFIGNIQVKCCGQLSTTKSCLRP